MGLDTSHEAWHGAYSAFMRWRIVIADLAGLPPLELMEGFFNPDQAVTGNPFWRQYADDKEKGYDGAFSVWKRLPIKWDCLKPSPLHTLLYHSDCEGKISWKDCGSIAAELEKLIPLMPKKDDGGHIGNWKEKTRQFIKGLKTANKAKQNLEFH